MMKKKATAGGPTPNLTPTPTLSSWEEEEGGSEKVRGSRDNETVFFFVVVDITNGG